MASVVQLSGVTRRFPGASRPALAELSLTVESGEVVCVVGPSGCGKSTTLRLVAGLDHPDSGSVSIAGRDVRHVAPQDRDVAMVFQGFALYPHLTARGNIEFPLRMRRASAADREREVARVSELLSLGPLLHRYPAALSGGERQRVAMARALVRRPAAFLFDEPLSNLDAALRAQLRADIGRLLRDLAASALYVTHDQVEAMALGDRVAVLRDGRLEQVGPPEELYRRPRTAFVGGFFGTPAMNLVPARRAEGADAAEVRFGSVALKAPTAAEAVLLGLRPEELALVSDDGWAGRVVAVEPHGVSTLVEVEADGVRLRALVPGFAPVRRTDLVRLRPAPGAGLWFDAGTEERLT